MKASWIAGLLAFAIQLAYGHWVTGANAAQRPETMLHNIDHSRHLDGSERVAPRGHGNREFFPSFYSEPSSKLGGLFILGPALTRF